MSRLFASGGQSSGASASGEWFGFVLFLNEKKKKKKVLFCTGSLDGDFI